MGMPRPGLDGADGGPPITTAAPRLPDGGLADLVAAQPEPLRPLVEGPRHSGSGPRLDPPVREWLQDLAVLGRGERTIRGTSKR